MTEYIHPETDALTETLLSNFLPQKGLYINCYDYNVAVYIIDKILHEIINTAKSNQTYFTKKTVLGKFYNILIFKISENKHYAYFDAQENEGNDICFCFEINHQSVLVNNNSQKGDYNDDYYKKINSFENTENPSYNLFIAIKNEFGNSAKSLNLWPIKLLPFIFFFYYNIGWYTEKQQAINFIFYYKCFISNQNDNIFEDLFTNLKELWNEHEDKKEADIIKNIKKEVRTVKNKISKLFQSGFINTIFDLQKEIDKIIVNEKCNEIKCFLQCFSNSITILINYITTNNRQNFTLREFIEYFSQCVSNK